MNFIFFVYLLGIIVAVYQDVTRREIDDWLNLFLFFSGFAFFIFSVFGTVNYVYSILAFCFFIVLSSVVSFGLYSARAFAGGDAKLLFALSPLFFQGLFIDSITNIIFFIVSLFFAGAIYSLCFSAYYLIKDFSKIKKFLILESKRKIYFLILMFAFLFFVLGFFFKFAFLICIFSLIFLILFLIARAVDSVSMIKKINTKNLREGDWLEKDVRIGGKVIKKTWEGLSLENIKIIQKYKKDISIKDGLPYAIAFFMALVLYYFKDIIFMKFLGY